MGRPIGDPGAATAMSKKRATGGDVLATPLASTDSPDGVDTGHWTFWSLGRRVEARVRDAGSKKAATRAIAAEERCSYSRVRVAHAFALTFPEPKDLVRLGRIRIRGRPLSEDHLRRLAMAEDRAQAETLLTVVERYELSSKQLGVELRRLKGTTAGAGGRKLIPPGSLLEGLMQVGWWTGQWLKHHDALWSGAPTWLTVLEGTQDGEELAARLQEVVDQLRHLRETADALEEKLLAIEAGTGRWRRRS
jgi:hypothetical protein